MTSRLWDNAMMEGPVTLLSRLLESPFTATVNVAQNVLRS